MERAIHSPRSPRFSRTGNPWCSFQRVRSSGEELAPFKSGLFHLASRFPQVEFIPVYLDNLTRIMPKGSFLIVPITCTARFGAPVALVADESKADFLARCRDAVLALSKPQGRE